MENRSLEPSAIFIGVAGLRYGAYAEVQHEIKQGTRLELRPVEDNPYDASAVEIWVTASVGPRRIGYVPRARTAGVRLGLENDPHVEIAVDYGGQGAPMVAFHFPIETEKVLEAFYPPVPEDPVLKARMAGYRSFFPGEKIDPDAPASEDDLVEPFLRKLRSEIPDFDEGEDDGLDLLEDAMETKWTLVRAPRCDAPSTEQKVGGLPYAEAGWEWPVCPNCGRDVIFMAQMRDPMNPDDLVQVFKCKDPDLELCHHWAAEEPETYSLVRLWRDPSPERIARIAPRDREDILPGFVTIRDETNRSADDMTRIHAGGSARTLNNQYLQDQGWHCVFCVLGLPEEVDDRHRLRPDTCVARHGRGQVVAFDDYG